MRIKDSALKSAKALWRSFPLLLGTILFVSLISVTIPRSWYKNAFSGSVIIDPLIGDLIGSVFAGNPLTSYIIAGELLKQGISLIAITSFIVSWVTVGIAQLPAEACILGKKFAILRNLTAFLLSILVSILTVLIIGIT